MTERYVCIHGHFYQPPRENPWLEAIELQDSAYPYHDWNERITAECYSPNAVSRILDGYDRIVQIVNNYARISFNFGPTLLSWLEASAPDTYRAILEADRESRRRFSGHGSAIAQAYNHPILPLASARDKLTQVLWGIRDFEHRFGRKPEGMWLPETAVDLETLDVLAEQGIAFTILAPHQAETPVDPTRAYRVALPSGRSLALFFYDGAVSRAVAFEGLLSRGEDFARRLVSAFQAGRGGPQLVHIATDGETYGHHHRFGDMALAYALHQIESEALARLTNYGEFLERHPPKEEVRIRENTSWSCPHGVERWRSDCGCRSGERAGWNQAWRAPLREALDWLRDRLAGPYEVRARELLKDPWAARDAYIDVILDRSPEAWKRFGDRQARRRLDPDQETVVLKLLELQRHALLMYTSCGWFFDDLTNIETIQIIEYAGRALQLASELFGDSLEYGFLKKLDAAKSNNPAQPDGRHIFENKVRAAAVDLSKIAAHYAVSSLFEPYPERAHVYCYTVERRDQHRLEARRARLIVGRAHVTSEVTHDWASLVYGVLHLGDHNVSGGLMPFQDEERFRVLLRELTLPFSRADFPEVIRLFDRRFGSSTYSLRSLFRDEQRKLLDAILRGSLAEAESAYSKIYEDNAPLLRYLRDLNLPLPDALATAAEFVVNSRLRRALEATEPDFEGLGNVLGEALLSEVALAEPSLGLALRRALERTAERLAESPTDLTRVKRLLAAVSLARFLPFELNLWKPQNVYYELLQTVYPEQHERAARSDGEARQWVEQFRTLGKELAVRVDPD